MLHEDSDKHECGECVFQIVSSELMFSDSEFAVEQRPNSLYVVVTFLRRTPLAVALAGAPSHRKHRATVFHVRHSLASPFAPLILRSLTIAMWCRRCSHVSQCCCSQCNSRQLNSQQAMSSGTSAIHRWVIKFDNRRLILVLFVRGLFMCRNALTQEKISIPRSRSSTDKHR